MAYLDDDLISISKDKGNTLKLFLHVNLTLRLNKCNFLLININYLGHKISGDGLRPGSDKIKAVTTFPPPTNIHEIRRFFGLTSYFRKFIGNFAHIAKLLTELTKKNFVWKNEQESVFEQLKQLLTE